MVIAEKLMGKFKDQITTLVNNDAMAIVLATLDGSILDANATFKGWLKISADEGLGNLYDYLDKRAEDMLKVCDDGIRQIKLQFANKGTVSLHLSCDISKQDGELLIIGQNPCLHHNESVEKLGEMTIELAPLSAELPRKNREFVLVKREIDTIHGLIPICSYCKSIRNDKGTWEQLETYLSDKSGARFSHGICESCYRSVMPNLHDDRNKAEG